MLKATFLILALFVIYSPAHAQENYQLCILPGATHGGAWAKKELLVTIMNDFFNKPFEMPDTKDWFVK